MKRFLHFLVRIEPLFLILVANILLRIPNLFEPYWYGDEGIYLTVGLALRNGLTLYKDIIDHKTPIIYLLAMAPSQFWFKFLLMAWTTCMLALFYRVAERFFMTKKQAYIATFFLMLLTALPFFEGNIANGELFVMGFMLGGLALFTRTSLWHSFFQHKGKITFDVAPLFGVGALFSLGALTKVPAIFDATAVGVLFFFLYLRKPSQEIFFALLRSTIILAVGFATPILLSIAYFATKHALGDYLAFGLLYNFRYSFEFSPPFSHPLLLFLFSMPGKLSAFAAIIALLVLARKRLSPQAVFVCAWMALTLFSALLSSRPYPHYFLQTFPPLALALAFWFGKVKSMFESSLVPVVCILPLVLILIGFQSGQYPMLSYYTTFLRFVRHDISTEQYRNQFNPLMADTYAAASYIQQTTLTNSRLFIWGTDPMLYALARRVPSGRFTVSFHIKDFNAYQETMDSLVAHPPQVIVVMREEDGKFPDFYTYLNGQYVLVKQLPTMNLYRRVGSK